MLLVLLILLVVSAVFAVVRPRWAFLASIFFAPWEGLDVDFGIRMSMYRVLAAGLLCAALVRRPRARGTWMRLPGAWWMLLAFAFVWTLLQLPYLPAYDRFAGGELRSGATRLLIQCVYFVLRFAPVFAASVLGLQSADLARAGRTYLQSCFILAVIGVAQFGIWMTTGFDITPVGRVNALLGGNSPHATVEQLPSPVLAIAGLRLLRITSLAGEPKGLGQALVIGLLLIQVVQGSLAPKQRRTLTRLWLLFFVGVLLTWSSSAFFLWAFGSAMHQIVALTTPAFRSMGEGALMRNLRSVRLAFLALLVLAAGASILGSDVFGELMASRTTERAQLEDYDATVWKFLMHEPEKMVAGVGLGAVHLYAYRFVSREWAHYMMGQVFVAKSGGLRFLSELGIIGLSLFLWGCVRCIRELLAVARRQRRAGPQQNEGKGEVVSLAFFALIILLCYLVRGYVENQLMMTLGLALAVTLRNASQASPQQARTPALPTPPFPRTPRFGAAAGGVERSRVSLHL